jgi:hypothetical protein
MQVQSSLAPAGIGTTTPSGTGSVIESAPAVPIEAPEPAATPNPSPADGKTPPPTVASPPPLPAERPAVAPRARLAFDADRARMYVEVLDTSTGDVLFTVPAHKANESVPGGLPQGSLVDQSV